MYLLSSKNEPQWLEYFNLVFLEIQNVTIRSVLLNLVTYCLVFPSFYKSIVVSLSSGVCYESEKVLESRDPLKCFFASIPFPV